MRGFPIVSLGSLTCINGWASCKLINPEFEYDEYYGEQIYNKYLAGYYKNEYDNNCVKSLEVFSNNINATEGEQIYNIEFSAGFDGRSVSTEGALIKDIYKNNEKLLKIKKVRFDTFYATTIEYSFFFNTDYDGYDANNFNENIYINAPNLNKIEDRFSLIMIGQFNNLLFNMPKLQIIGAHFLTYNTVQQNMYFLTPQLNQIYKGNLGGWTQGNRYIISISLEENERISSLINATITRNEINVSNFVIPASKATILPGDTTCTYTDFDVRYWSEEQNSSGSDR